MMQLDQVVNLLLGVLTGVSTLAILAVGLAVVFGMMGVINFAHGEFVMLGAFLTISGVKAGLPVAVAMVFASLAVGMFGLIVERILIRRLYGRLEATMLCTFGLSLIMVQGSVFIWGLSTMGIATPLGTFKYGVYSIAQYRLVFIGAAVGLLLLVYLVFKCTKFGLAARAAMQIPNMAASVGVDARRMNAWTFAFGSALAGAAGALISPTVAVSPSMGATYIARAFVTVVVGGPGVVTGTVSSSALLGTVERTITDLSSPMIGTAALLAVSIVLIRFLPSGISGRFGKQL